MSPSAATHCAAFDGGRLIAAGPLKDVALAVKAALAAGAAGPVLTFGDADGAVLDLDLRGSEAEIIARLGANESEAPPTRGRGRPRLGVVAREVTLLPRHWDWLAAQPGGASAALRRLVEEARRSSGAKDRVRLGQEAAYRFMAAMAGDLPGFEEATRALFAGDRARFARHMAQWPSDVGAYATKLAEPAWA
jgi:hypothetical protein